MADNTNVVGHRYSAINAMHMCRLMCWLVYGKRFKGYQNPYAKLGTVAHDIIEDYGKHCLATGQDTDYDEYDKIALKYIHRLEQDQLKDALEVFETIKGNLNWGVIKQFPVVEIERRFKLDSELNPTDDEDPYFSGAIDLCCCDTEVAYATDWKTPRAIYTKKYMEESLQRKIYSLLILKHYQNINEVNFAFHFSRYGWQSPWMVITRDMIPVLEDMLKAELQALTMLINEVDPPDASPGSHCMLCPNRALCDEYKHAFEDLERLETQDDARKLYGAYKLAQMKLKVFEKQLKAWVDTHGPIEMPYEVYTIRNDPKIEYPDTKKLIDVLFREGKVPEGAIYDCLSLSNTNVQKLIKKFKLPETIKESIKKISKESKVAKYVTQKIEEEADDSEDGIDPYL